MSFLHTVFVREHNIIVNEFRKLARDNPDADSGSARGRMVLMLLDSERSPRFGVLKDRVQLA